MNYRARFPYRYRAKQKGEKDFGSWAQTWGDEVDTWVKAVQVTDRSFEPTGNPGEYRLLNWGGIDYEVVFEDPFAGAMLYQLLKEVIANERKRI